MKKTKVIKFVECKEASGLQFWAGVSCIFHICKCGKELSYDTPGVKKHWEKYEIIVPIVSVKNFDAWYKAIEEKVAANPELYRVADWSQKC